MEKCVGGHVAPFLIFVAAGLVALIVGAIVGFLAILLKNLIAKNLTLWIIRADQADAAAAQQMRRRSSVPGMAPSVRDWDEETQWYFKDLDNEKQGPCSDSDMRYWIETEQLCVTQVCRAAGSTVWLAISESPLGRPLPESIADVAQAEDEAAETRAESVCPAWHVVGKSACQFAFWVSLQVQLVASTAASVDRTTLPPWIRWFYTALDAVLLAAPARADGAQEGGDGCSMGGASGAAFPFEAELILFITTLLCLVITVTLSFPCCRLEACLLCCSADKETSAEFIGDDDMEETGESVCMEKLRTTRKFIEVGFPKNGVLLYD